MAFIGCIASEQIEADKFQRTLDNNPAQQIPIQDLIHPYT